jgi:hypothetical protein
VCPESDYEPSKAVASLRAMKRLMHRSKQPLSFDNLGQV